MAHQDIADEGNQQEFVDEDSTTKIAVTAQSVAEISFADLEQRRDAISSRLNVISVEDWNTKKKSLAAAGIGGGGGGGGRKRARNSTSTKPVGPPIIEKGKDVHWDFVMKEMMWLSADFQAERKRQVSTAKRIASSIRQYHKSKETRRRQKLADAELKRRKLAGRLSREVRGWWTKIERVITYKQKLAAEEERKKAMNKQLVSLVRQTERYTESLAQLSENDDDDDDHEDESDDDNSDKDNDNKTDTDDTDSKRSSDTSRSGRKSKRRRRRYHHKMTIEEALASAVNKTRRSKARITDYTKIQLDEKDCELYGVVESATTTSDSGSDASYSPSEDDWWDDETTILEAEELEISERIKRQQQQQQQQQQHSVPSASPLLASSTTTSFTADPEELRKLVEESTLSIEDVLRRLSEEGRDMMEVDNHSDPDPDRDGGTKKPPRRKVQFSSTVVELGVDKESSVEGATVMNGSTSIPVNGSKGSGGSAAAVEAAEGKILYDADDDGDASDVEDFVVSHHHHHHHTEKSNDDGEGGERKKSSSASSSSSSESDNDDNDHDDGDDEFKAPDDINNLIDDETTIAQEEMLPRDMSTEDEIKLLKEENEMSIEELRKKYYNNCNDQENLTDNMDTDDQETKEEEEGFSEGEEQEQRQGDKKDAATGDSHKRNGILGELDKNDEFGPGTISNAEEKATTSHDNDDDHINFASVVVGEDSNDDEFVPIAGADHDDETTIEAEERLGRTMTYEEELSILQRENEMSVEQLRALYYQGSMDDDDDDNDNDDMIDSEAEPDIQEQVGTHKGQREAVGELQEPVVKVATGGETKQPAIEPKSGSQSADCAMTSSLTPPQLEGSTEEGGAGPTGPTAEARSSVLDDDRSSFFTGEGENEDDEFVPTGVDHDDETTIEAEEKLGRTMTYEEELSILQKENEMSIEELRAMYYKQESTNDEDDDGNDSQNEEDIAEKVELDGAQPAEGLEKEEEKTGELKEASGEGKREEKLVLLEQQSLSEQIGSNLPIPVSLSLSLTEVNSTSNTESTDHSPTNEVKRSMGLAEATTTTSSSKKSTNKVAADSDSSLHDRKQEDNDDNSVATEDNEDDSVPTGQDNEVLDSLETRKALGEWKGSELSVPSGGAEKIRGYGSVTIREQETTSAKIEEAFSLCQSALQLEPGNTTKEEIITEQRGSETKINEKSAEPTMTPVLSTSSQLKASSKHLKIELTSEIIKNPQLVELTTTPSSSSLRSSELIEPTTTLSLMSSRLEVSASISKDIEVEQPTSVQLTEATTTSSFQPSSSKEFQTQPSPLKKNTGSDEVEECASSATSSELCTTRKDVKVEESTTEIHSSAESASSLTPSSSSFSELKTSATGHYAKNENETARSIQMAETATTFSLPPSTPSQVKLSSASKDMKTEQSTPERSAPLVESITSSPSKSAVFTTTNDVNLKQPFIQNGVAQMSESSAALSPMLSSQLGTPITRKDGAVEQPTRENKSSIQLIESTNISSSTSKEDDGEENVEIFSPREEEDGEFVPSNGVNDVDDETTIAAEEKLGRTITYEEELSLLQKENEMPIEELRAMVAAAAAAAAAADDDDNDYEEDDDKGLHSGRNVQADNEVILSEQDEIQAEAVVAAAVEPLPQPQPPPSSISTRTTTRTGTTFPSRTACADSVLTGKDVDDNNEEDEEFKPEGEEVVDDETTIEAEERLGRDMSYEAEIALLQQENEMSIEELKAKYAGMAQEEEVDDNINNQYEKDNLSGDEGDGGNPYSTSFLLTSSSTTLSSKRNETFNGRSFIDDSSNDDEEYKMEHEDIDDETTLIAEERMGREMSAEDEIALLQRESETPIESLYEMYTKMEEEQGEAMKMLGQNKKGSLSSILVSSGEGLPVKTKRKRKRKREHDSHDDDAATEEDDNDYDDDANNKQQSNRDEDSIAEDDEGSSSVATTGDADEGLVAIHALEASAERARRTRASRPYLLASWVKLREYQQTGLNWLVSLQSRRLNGILADEMGLGKTLQTISLLGYLASYKGIWGPHLVIVPTSVIINWETELKRFCPALKVLCYYGSAKRRKELRTGWTKTNWHHVVITSYQLAVQDSFAFKRKRWYYLVLDEAQNIKNFQSQRWQTLINFNTQRRLLLTGTPLQNNLMELWSLLHFLMPYVFRSRKEFSYWFSNPMNNMIEGNANQSDEMITRLHGIIRPFVLRRLKKDVETQMPSKYEHIVKCQLSRRQMFFYEEFMARSSTRQAMKKGGNFMGMMNVLMQLRKVCNHPDLFEPRSVVTPFVVEGINLSVPDLVMGATRTGGILERTSTHMMAPLWCGSGSERSLVASIDHDTLVSARLLQLEANLEEKGDSEDDEDGTISTHTHSPEFLKLVRELKEVDRRQKKSKLQFQNNLNSWRCQAAAAPYTADMLRAYQIQGSPLQVDEINIMSTPSQLLEMRRTHQQRAHDMDEMVKNFVFAIPKAGARRPTLDAKEDSEGNSTLQDMLLEPIEEYLKPFRKAHARLSAFFPDKKLVQFDAGKLQTLAELLHELKRGGHRALIFTQMSKMLDILEAFLNLHAHTYLRLDGSTGVDRRQRLMDRFNNDTKVFCFILSTRSGGMGINLTGADTVIFYDSDWNPAMDAQAQDRAHRIGQTRDVHIYRLVTAHTIEENILVKAQQKKNLDILVMDKGKFHGAETSDQNGPKDQSQSDQVLDVYTKGGLRAILGVAEDSEKGSSGGENEEKKVGKQAGENLSKEQMEAAMTKLEDQDDVLALRGAQKEAADQLREFDETVDLKDSEDPGVADGESEKREDASEAQDNAKKKDEKKDDNEKDENEEEELEKEFAAWQSEVGMDASAIEASFTPTERYGLHFREEIDPFVSIFQIMEDRRKLEATEDQEEIDIDSIEREKAAGERRAIDDGDLLATRPKPEDLVRQRNLYRREKSRLRADKKRRKLTGENWTSKTDTLTQKSFWYNSDTGEGVWDKPAVLVELEAEDFARRNSWQGLPIKSLVRIMSFLIPFPERVNCARVCHQWKAAASDISFVLHVFPVEMGGLARDGRKLEKNHFCTIKDALDAAKPGDAIELGDGHYWVNEPGLSVDFPIKLVGDEHNASNVVIEMTGTVKWRGIGGWIEGVTLRRPKISSGETQHHEMIRLEGGRFDMVHSVIDNEGSNKGNAVKVSGVESGGRWLDVTVKGGKEAGIELDDSASLELIKCHITGNKGNGLFCRNKSEFSMVDSSVSGNNGYGIRLRSGSHGKMCRCEFSHNSEGVMDKETDCSYNSNHNVAIDPISRRKREVLRGFRFLAGVCSSDDNVNK